MSTEWQAMQFLDFAKAKSAMAGAATVRVRAKVMRARFIVVFLGLGYIVINKILMNLVDKINGIS